MGTVAYLSPEQVTRGVADPRSDVYAAGILLFEMLTGVKPYDGDTAIQVAYRHVHDDVPAPSTLVPGLPAELDHLVARATSRDPDLRPADARRFHAEVVAARRAMSEGELDTLGPALAAMTSQPDQTLVVDLNSRTATGARRGDTGPLAGTSGGVHGARARRSKGPLALLLILVVAAVLSGAAWLVAAGPAEQDHDAEPGGADPAPRPPRRRTRAGSRPTSRATGSARWRRSARCVATDPGRGENVDKNGTVELFLSKGPERYAVPSVVGKHRGVRPVDDRGQPPDRRHAGAALQQQGRRRALSSRPSPAAGVELERDQAVVLVISDGPEPVAVPNVVGQPVDQAKAAVIDAGLEPQVREKFDETIPAGTVISQSPEGNRTAGKGSVLKLVVSKGPPLVDVPDVKGKNVTEAQAPDHRGRPGALRPAAARRPRHRPEPVARRRRPRAQGLDGHPLRLLTLTPGSCTARPATGRPGCGSPAPPRSRAGRRRGTPPRAPTWPTSTRTATGTRAAAGNRARE